MPAVIFSGDTVKALKSALKLSDNSTITSGSSDPTSVATAGVAGDVYISTNTKLIYVKQDSGTTTNWNSPFFSDGVNFNYNTGTHTLTVANLTVNGTTTNINTTNVNVSDKLVILNKGGATSSGSNVGFEVEENSVIKGYIQTSADRNSWQLQAPGTSGVASISPGTGGIRISGNGNGILQSGSILIDNVNAANPVLTVMGAPSDAPSDLLFDATYTNGSSLDATYVKQGSPTPTSTNASPVVTSSKLDLTSDTSQWVVYDGTALSEATQTGTIRFRYTPNYSGSPSNTQRVLASGSDSSSINRIEIVHATDGTFEADLWDSSGSNIITIAFPYTAVSGTETEIEFNWDITTGASRIFKDGVQQSSTNTATGTRTNSSTGVWVGTDNFLTTNGSKFSITDIVVYSTVQHTSNYTAPIAPLLGPFTQPQTADLQQWKNSGSMVLTSIDKDGFLTLVGDPTTGLMAATKQYVDNTISSRIQVFTSNPGSGGSGSETLIFTGILSTDTILSVTQQTPGSNGTSINGYNSLSNDTLLVSWTSNPGAGAVVVVSVLR